MASVRIGARWDEAGQDDRVSKARERGLIDYIEVNYPTAYDADPYALGIPVLAHTSSNPTCSVHGVNRTLASMVKAGADKADSPWVGEHLTWLGASEYGSLGYQINPLFTPEFRDLAVDNLTRLRDYYDRKIAIELSPIYVGATAYESEMHFLADVATAGDFDIILDVTHWQIANLNLERPEDYALDAMPADRIVELHVAGMRKGSDEMWHDAHENLPSDEVYAVTDRLVDAFPNLNAITFEHHPNAPESDFFVGLERLNEVIGDRRAAA